VAPADQIPCGNDSISRQECERKGCCYELGGQASSCFYGLSGAVECTKDGHVLIVLTKKMTVPPLDLDSVHLLDEGPNCKPVNKTESFILFKIPFGTCGTTSRVAGSYVLYENEIIADRNIIRGPSGSITRDSTLRIHIQCRYMGRDSLPLNVQVFTLAPPLPVTEPGPLHLELRISKGESYGAYYHVSEYPVVKNLREPVFLEVRLLNRTDPSIVLMLDDCWATPTPNPLDKLMWKILVDGCPYTEDNYRTRLQNVDASGLKFPFHYKRFIVKTFAFVDSATEQPFKGQVYFHCSALVCHPSASEPCTMKCATVGSRRQRSVDLQMLEQQSRQAIVTSEGPVIFKENLENTIRIYPFSGAAAFVMILALCTVGIAVICKVKRQNQ
uniref:Zona pellucida sperm-binding protein 4 n=1 Tax=Latimeria chalumnae TaxID=7897 RepID=H3A7N6_LATCH